MGTLLLESLGNVGGTVMAKTECTLCFLILPFVFDEMGRTCGRLICVKLKMKSDAKGKNVFAHIFQKLLPKNLIFGGVILEFLAKNHHSFFFNKLDFFFKIEKWQPILYIQTLN